MSARAFVDFYSQNKISPVAQDISDLGAHFARREALYRHLGIVPALIAGRSVLEFGPGSGYNALYTAQLMPERYVLVDGNPTGLAEARRLLGLHFASAQPDFVESLIEDYPSGETFDLVLCEGLLPYQNDPASLARCAGRFVKAGGLFIITTIDAVSFHSEIVRRLMSDQIVDSGEPIAARLALLRPAFEPHLATLAGRTRPVGDWILDNILNPIVGKLFSIPEAIEALREDFEPYGSSPNFSSDWRWYKDVPALGGHGATMLAAYHAGVANLLDYRITLPPTSPESGARILTLCENVYERMQRVERANQRDLVAQVRADLDAIADCVRPLSELTAAAIEEAAAYFTTVPSAQAIGALTRFGSLFGRGQQYLSFIRK